MTMTYFLHCTHPFTCVTLLILRCSTPSSKTKIYTCLERISNNTHCSLTLMIGACTRLRQVFILPRSRDSLCLLSRKKAKPQLKYVQSSRLQRMELKETICCIYKQTKKALK